jgi:hypothetical protein
MDKKRKTVASSKGSKYTLYQSKRIAKDSKILCSLAQNSVTVSNLINSCPCEPPCLQNIFTNEPGVIDFNAAVSFIEDAQKSFIQLDDDDQDVFIINKFKESIINIDE